jgi:hypothetical protein
MADSTEPQPAPEPPSQVGAGIDWTDPNSPLAPLYLRSIHILVAVLLALLFVANTMFPLWHTDVWGHVRYGQWMVENKAIPDREPFCPWWDGRIRFTQFYTISQTVMYTVYHLGERLAGGDEVRQLAGGSEALRFLHALCVTLRYAILYYAFSRFSGSARIALLGFFGVILLDLSNMAVLRPQTFGQIFFAMLLVPLSREILSRRAMILIPLLTAVWANTHGSYLVVHGILFALLIGRICECLFGQPRGIVWPWQDVQARRLAITLVLVVLAVCLNPYGPSLYSRTMDMTRHPSLITAVGEWQPMSFSMGTGWHWPFLASLALVGLSALLSKRALPMGHLFVLFLFGLGVCVQNRMVIWWAMVVPWVLMPLWADLASQLPERFVWKPSTPSLKKTFFAALVALATMATIRDGLPKLDTIVSSGTPWPVAHQIANPTAETSQEWQTEFKKVLEATYGGQFRGAILATPMQGDYLMYALAPKVPVTYAHIHLFHPDFWDELGVVGQGRPGWWDIVNRYQINLFVVEAEYCDQLLVELKKRPTEWKILLDESGSTTKQQKLNRQMIAVRLKPL